MFMLKLKIVFFVKKKPREIKLKKIKNVNQKIRLYLKMPNI